MKNLKEKQCKVCNYAWLAKLEEPKQCPYCKSMKWNKKRKYALNK